MIFNAFFASKNVIGLDGVNSGALGGFLDHRYATIGWLAIVLVICASVVVENAYVGDGVLQHGAAAYCQPLLPPARFYRRRIGGPRGIVEELVHEQLHVVAVVFEEAKAFVHDDVDEGLDFVGDPRGGIWVIEDVG